MTAHDRPLLAVLGGGQLGRMLALAGLPLGVRFRFLDPGAEAPARELGPLVVGGLGDRDALLATAADADVVTYEWEGVPADAATVLGDAGHVVRPGRRALEVAQDRLAEKTLFRSLGIGVPDFAPVDDEASLRAAVGAIGLPAVLKTRRGGYDGKGQVVLREDADVARAWTELGAGAPLILERLVPFTRELSVLAARGVDGDTRVWPLVENTHVGGILRVSRAPAPDCDAQLVDRATRAVHALLDELDYVGVLALELFQDGDELLANEMAPRVHNSGHWTIEGAATSQFEQHVRAVLGWPLGSTAAVGESAMVNLIGSLPDPAAIAAIEGAHLHRYGKAPRPGRKVGHITVAAPDATTLASRLAAVEAARPADVG